MSVWKRLCLLVGVLLGWGTPAWAETRYVADVLVINLRAAPSASSETLALLRTGEGFEVLGAEGSFLRVRTPGGQEGWVSQQYTTGELPKALVIEGLRQQLAKTRQELAEAKEARESLEGALHQAEQRLSQAADAVAQELDAARQRAQESTAQYQRVKKEYDALLEQSGRVLDIAAERDVLAARNAEVEARAQQAEGELAEVTRSQLLTGLLAGGGLVLAGWVIGSTARKKKSRFSVG